MPAPFPETGVIDVPPALADELLRAAERLPPYDDVEFYSPPLQEHVLGRVRAGCRDSFEWLTGQLAERVARRPYCALVRGLRFDKGNCLFVAVNRAFGELVAPPYRKPRAQLVHYVEPATDIDSPRGGRESERLHTDTTVWETPVELISMLCVRPDHQGGGRSRLLDVDSIREEVGARLGPAALGLLETEPVPWQMADYCGGGVRWAAVLGGSGVRWRRLTINMAVECEGAEVSAEVMSALDAFERVIESSPLTLDLPMGAGELLFMDNRRAVHARTPIADAARSDRLMIRSWMRAS